MAAQSAAEVVPMDPSMQEQVDTLESKLIERALKKHKGNLRQAAAFLGVSRSGLYKKIGRLKINAESFRPDFAFA